MAIKLQKPSIISIQGSTIRIAHPDISQYTRTFLISPFIAGASSASLADNDNFENTNVFILGEVGDEKTEEGTVNTSVTRGTSIGVAYTTPTTRFSHELDTPVTRIFERQIRIFGNSVASESGSPATIATIDITWGKDATEYTDVSSAVPYAYYYVKFYDGTTLSEVSDFVSGTGLTYNSAEKFIQSALDITNSKIDDLITREFLVRCVQDCQDSITQFIDNRGLKKDWSFEIVENATSIPLTTMENSYSLSGLTYAFKYPNSNHGIINIRIGNNYPITYFPISEYDEWMEGKTKTTVATQAAIGATSLVLADSSEFADDGSVIAGVDTLTYTANNKTTNTLSGIPASGTGSITATKIVGSTVWQGVSGGLPQHYTIFNGRILFDVPVSTTYSFLKVKIRYYKALTRITEPSDTTEIPFTNIFQYYIAAKILMRKGRLQEADAYLLKFSEGVFSNAKADKSYAAETTSYYSYTEADRVMASASF